jgi:hypothetical protein
MLANTAFVWLSLALSARAFFIPEGVEDGVYFFDPTTGVHTTANGTVVSRDLDTAPQETRMHPRELGNSGKLNARKNGDSNCGDTIVSSLDYTSALNQLTKTCDGKTKIGGHVWAKYGDAMIFVCTYGTSGIFYSNADTCTTGTVGDGVKTNLLTTLTQIDTDCGKNILPDHKTGKEDIFAIST